MAAAPAVDVVGHLGKPRAEGVDHRLDLFEERLVRRVRFFKPRAGGLDLAGERRLLA